MKNAPLYFSIAQVRHNPVLRLGAYADEIQDRMRKAGYPDFRKGVAMAISLISQIDDAAQRQQPSVEKVERLVFSSSNNTKGFIVEQNAVSFQTTGYQTFESFIDEFMKGLGMVHECLTLAHAERVGLRYLAAIVPPNGEEGLSDYLVSGVLGLSRKLPEDVQVSHSFSETHFRTAGCAVLSRTIILAGPLGFPMDLQPIGVKLAERFQKINGVHAIVDTDASIEGRHALSLAGIKSRLTTLRAGIDVAFNAVVMPAALQAWKI